MSNPIPADGPGPRPADHAAAADSPTRTVGSGPADDTGPRPADRTAATDNPRRTVSPGPAGDTGPGSRPADRTAATDNPRRTAGSGPAGDTGPCPTDNRTRIVSAGSTDDSTQTVSDPATADNSIRTVSPGLAGDTTRTASGDADDNPLEPVATPLTATQRKGLNRLGNVVIPGARGLPSFSESGSADGINAMLPDMYDADRRSLLGLLGACAVLPTPAIRAMVKATSMAASAPAPLAGLLRLANVGIKGVVQSLYWSDVGRGRVHERIGYAARIDEQAYERSLGDPAEWSLGDPADRSRRDPDERSARSPGKRALGDLAKSAPVDPGGKPSCGSPDRSHNDPGEKPAGGPDHQALRDVTERSLGGPGEKPARDPDKKSAGDPEQGSLRGPER